MTDPVQNLPLRQRPIDIAFIVIFSLFIVTCFISGTSAFVYLPFYVILILSLARGWNRIQLFAVIYATMIISLTAIPIFGVEFFGPVGERTPNPVGFLLYNGPYVVLPLLLLIRMGRPLPFARRY